MLGVLALIDPDRRADHADLQLAHRGSSFNSQHSQIGSPAVLNKLSCPAKAGHPVTTAHAMDMITAFIKVMWLLDRPVKPGDDIESKAKRSNPEES